MTRGGAIGALKYSCAVSALLLTAGASHAQNPTQLQGITVASPAAEPQGDSGTQAGGDPSTKIDGYVAESTSTGTKTDTPLREIPQSVSVVTREQIDERGATTLSDAIAYSAGIAVNPYGLDGRYDQFIIRGFEQNTTGIYRDGLRLPIFSFTGIRVEPQGVDHIDIMRGPTSTLYGLNNPGGLVNVVSKTPPDQAFGEIWASYGTWDAKSVGFDFGAPSDNGKVSYRITGLIRDADTQVDFVENDRVFIAPSLTFRPTDATTFTILANYQKDTTSDSLQLLPAEAVRDGSIPRDTFLGEPGYSNWKGEQWGIGYQLEHKFDPAVTFRQNLRYDHASTDYQTVYPAQGAGPDLVLMGAQDADETARLFQVDNTIQIDSKYDRVDNKLLFGFDYSRFSVDSKLGFGVLGNLVKDPSNPSYGFPGFLSIADVLFGNLTNFQSKAPSTLDQSMTQETVGLYVQDQIKIDNHWVVTLGGRYDWVDAKVTDHKLDDAVNNPTDTIADDGGSSDDKAFTYRAGLNYLFDNGLTPYVSYSTSFFPVPLTSTNGVALKPEEGQQYEAGIKYQPAGFKSWGLVSVFDLTKQNATQAGPVPGTFTQTGEIQVRGLEIEAVIDFDNGWRVLGAYNYWDAEITKDATPANNVGNRPERIPEQLASIWLDYTFRTGMFKGLGLGAGVRYFGDTFGDAANLYDVPSNTLVDAAIRYQWDNWQLALNVLNVLDDDYIGTCGAVSLTGADPYEYCSYGQGRNATVKLGYRW
ncbi:MULTISPECIES: TonB-dependent siderophore receptor [Rhodomicrobium]|uniref:TonB-dependent siderophore receptor n=1 Tax=Rhodomicrobium TaxID=1068 RepID=UPI00148295CB|nr:MULTISPECIES: TonB-dependent siderophore receptor [Rhodomicrobium]